MTPRQMQVAAKAKAAAMPPPAASQTMSEALTAAEAVAVEAPAAAAEAVAVAVEAPAAAAEAVAVAVEAPAVAVSDSARELLSHFAVKYGEKPDAFLVGRPASLARWHDGRRLPAKLAGEYLPKCPALSKRALILAKRTLDVVLGCDGNYTAVPADTSKPDHSGAPRKALQLQPLAYRLASDDVDRQIAAAAAAAEKGGASAGEAALAWYPLGMTKDGRKALRAEWVSRLLQTRYWPDVLRAAEELAAAPGWFLQAGNVNGVGASLTLSGLIKSRASTTVSVGDWE